MALTDLIRGRQVVLYLTNKSGGQVVAGDVVVIDTSNDTAFTTTTSARIETSIGVAQETIANDAAGRVLVAGYAALVNVPASVTRGHYIETHTVAKQATGNSTRRTGSFGQFATGGTTPTAWLWGSTDPTATAGTASNLQSARYVRSAGNYTTTNTALEDVDGTNMNFSITTGARRCLIIFQGTVFNSGTGITTLEVLLDGSQLGNTITSSAGGLIQVRQTTANYPSNASFTYLTDVLSAASHTFKLQWCTTAGTSTMHGGGSTAAKAEFAVVELYA